MKKTIICILLSCILIFPLALSASGAKLSCGTQALVNDPLLVKGGIYGEDVKFNDADFRQALGVTTYPDIVIESLPDMQMGTLKVDGLRVTQGQVIRRTQIDRLTFTPATHMVKEATFTFSCGTLCGGATLTCSIRFTDKLNEAPTATGISERCLKVQKNLSIYGTLCAYDPEDDDLTYIIISYPEKGALKVVDAASGDFSYTPKKNYKGTDSFAYVVRDSYGNYSSITTVTIEVNGEDTNIDLETPSYRLVTREEFLVALIKSYGYFPVSTGATFFDDDEDISLPAKPYVKTALDCGVICGRLDGGDLLFSPQALITYEEACSMMCVLDPTLSLPESSYAHLTPYLTYYEMETLLDILG